MKRKFWITLVPILFLGGALYYFIVYKNVVLYVSNHSRYAEEIHLQAWLNGKLILEDQLKQDLTGNEEQTFRHRGNKGFNKLLVRVTYKNFSTQLETVFEIEDIEFLVITVDDNLDREGQLNIVTNDYNLREAWNMNLILHLKQ